MDEPDVGQVARGPPGGDVLPERPDRIAVVLEPGAEVAADVRIGRVGGNLTEVLESISTTIRERGKLRREVKVITSMQRMSAYVIGVLPFGLAGIIFTINPDYMMRLFEPGLILCIPIGAFTSAIIGFFIIRNIADIKV